MRTALGLFAVAIGAVAQTAVTSAPQVAVRSGAIGGMITAFDGNFSLQAVVGHPYSADQVSEHVQTLADGTHITQAMQQTTKLYRDSAGRTRTEHVFTPRPELSWPQVLLSFRSPTRWPVIATCSTRAPKQPGVRHLHQRYSGLTW